MANTYHDSTLTAEKIDQALHAISGVIVPANNNKVLAISNGKIVARSVQWGGGSAALEPLSVTANGDYYPGSGVDGFDEVHVAVPGSPTLITKNITQNGTYNASSDNADGYSQVTVNVSGGGDDPFALTDYIESSGTQYIDTGCYLSDNSVIEVVATVSSTLSSSETIFGVRAAASSGADAHACLVLARGGTQSSSNFAAQFGNAMSFPVANASYKGNKCLYTLKNGGFKVEYKNGVPAIGVVLTAGSGVTTLYPLFVFALNTGGSLNAGTLCPMKLYRLRIYEVTALAHEFVPWIDGSNVVCLKDTVTGNLKYNAGTGVFTYGTDT